MITAIDHVVITTAQPEALLAFYEKLGFRKSLESGRAALYAGNFKINVHTLGSELTPHAGHIQPGSADFCFTLAGSLAEWRSKLEANGIAIELGIVPRSGTHGAMQSIYLRDPDKNLLEFCSYE